MAPDPSNPGALAETSSEQVSFLIKTESGEIVIPCRPKKLDRFDGFIPDEHLGWLGKIHYRFLNFLRRHCD